MAAKKKTADEAENAVETTAAVETAAEPAQAKATGSKIPLDKLKRSCLKLFGVNPSTFDGATMGLTGKYTIDEMKAIIDDWLKKEVK